MPVTGLEPVLIKVLGPPVGRAAGTAASKAGGFLYSDWRRRTSAKKTRRAVVSNKVIENSLIANVPDVTPEIAALLTSYFRSADFADICLKLALELAPLSTERKGQAAKTSSIKAELLVSLRVFVSSIDADATEVIGNAVFAKLIEATIEASSSHTVPEGVSPELRAIAVMTAANAAEASVRNTNLLNRLGSLAAVWQFEARLREQVRASHANMKLPHAGTTRKVPYKSLFVEPRLITQKMPSAKASAADFMQEEISLSELVSDFPCAVILGNPGGGKSTLALKHTYDIARGPIQSAKPAVPLLVILRDYVEAFKNEKQTLVTYLESLCRDPYNVEPVEGAIEYLLLNGRAYVIFDGLDELTDVSVRQRLVQNVEAFANLYPTAPILVTSREVGYDQASLDASIFQVFKLAPLDEDQVEDYTEKWFSLDDSIEKRQRRALARGFISDSQYVADLRTNPLMLSLMCGIYSSEHYIPANRPEVYRKCAELLFERWDKQRGIFTPLPFDAHVRLALNALALWMYSDPNLQNGLTRDSLTRFMTQYLREKRFSDEAEAENAAVQFIDFCTGRAWVLTDIGSNPHQELYGFTHRTFLEYFAANQLVRLCTSASSLFDRLSDKLMLQEWDVVAQLALQILGNNVEDGSDDFLALAMNLSATLEDALLPEAAHPRRNLNSFAARSLAFVVPRPDVIKRIVHECVNSLYRDRGLDYAARQKSGPRVYRELLECSEENLPMVARALAEDLKERLDNDTNNEFILLLSLFAGEYTEDGLNPDIGSQSRREFWYREQQSYLERYHGIFESQAREKPWFDVMRATLGEIPIAEVIARHGLRALFVYRPAGISFSAPLAFRYWNSSFRNLGWRDQQINVCASELPNVLNSLPAPWLDLADKEIEAAIRAMASRGGDDLIMDGASAIPTMLMALPIIEGVPDDSWQDPHRRPFPRVPDSEFHASDMFDRLYKARVGDAMAQAEIMRLAAKFGADSTVHSLLEGWITKKNSFSYISSPSIYRKIAAELKKSLEE